MSRAFLILKKNAKKAQKNTNFMENLTKWKISV